MLFYQIIRLKKCIKPLFIRLKKCFFALHAVFNFPSHVFPALWPSILAHQQLEHIFGPLQYVQVYNYIDQCSKVEIIHLTSKAKS